MGEFKLNLINTSPSVIYRIIKKNSEIIEIQNPEAMPHIMNIQSIEEPWAQITIIIPEQYLGPILKLCTDRRGIQIELKYIDQRVIIIYKIPLNEIIINFYDKLKSISSGYASFDYQITSYQKGDLVKVDILINNSIINAFSFISHRSKAEKRGRDLCKNLRNSIPRQLYV